MCTSTACSVKPSEPTLPDGNYLWRIKSKSAYGEGEYDTRLYFEVDSSVSSDVCGASENLLEIGSSYYMLTLPEFCLGGSAYVGDTGIRLGFDGRWSLETILNGKDTWLCQATVVRAGTTWFQIYQFLSVNHPWILPQRKFTSHAVDYPAPF